MLDMSVARRRSSCTMARRPSLVGSTAWGNNHKQGALQGVWLVGLTGSNLLHLQYKHRKLLIVFLPCAQCLNASSSLHCWGNSWSVRRCLRSIHPAPLPQHTSWYEIYLGSAVLSLLKMGLLQPACIAFACHVSWQWISSPRISSIPQDRTLPLY